MGEYSDLVTSDADCWFLAQRERPRLPGRDLSAALTAKYDLPVLWVALYEIDDINVQEWTDGTAPVRELILMSSKERALSSLERRRNVFTSAFGPRLDRLIDQFHSYLAAGYGKNVLVDSNALAAMGTVPEACWRAELVHSIQCVSGLEPKAFEIRLPRRGVLERVFRFPPRSYSVGAAFAHSTIMRGGDYHDEQLAGGGAGEAAPWEVLSSEV